MVIIHPQLIESIHSIIVSLVSSLRHVESNVYHIEIRANRNDKFISYTVIFWTFLELSGYVS